jgi:hypothetical protein
VVEKGSRTTLVSLLDYVGFIATLDMVFAFAELFQPELVVHEGRRFLASGFTQATYDGWVQKGTSPKEIQRVMNHIHISTLIQNQEVSDEAACEAAQAIALIWSRTLGPEGLQVEAIGDDFMDAAVTFFERTKA